MAFSSINLVVALMMYEGGEGFRSIYVLIILLRKHRDRSQKEVVPGDRIGQGQYGKWPGPGEWGGVFIGKNSKYYLGLQ